MQMTTKTGILSTPLMMLGLTFVSLSRQVPLPGSVYIPALSQMHWQEGASK
jgi:hypothetical protein